VEYQPLQPYHHQPQIGVLLYTTIVTAIFIFIIIGFFREESLDREEIGDPRGHTTTIVIIITVRFFFREEDSVIVS